MMLQERAGTPLLKDIPAEYTLNRYFQQEEMLKAIKKKTPDLIG